MIRRFNRFELKYVVPASTRDAFIDELRAHVSSDPEGGPSGLYAVTSLYYDSPDRSCFRAKLDGVRYRRKLRIRRYGDGAEPSPLAMVEIKQRIGRTTQKRRLAVRLSDAYRLCAGGGGMRWYDPHDAAVAGEVEWLVRALSLRPTCVIGYRRQAFVGSRYEPGLRITLDQGLWSSAPGDGLSGGTTRHTFLPPQLLILEVKANDAVPLWVSRLLARHHCALSRYSKYCEGLMRLPEPGQWPSGAGDPSAEPRAPSAPEEKAHG